MVFHARRHANMHQDRGSIATLLNKTSQRPPVGDIISEMNLRHSARKDLGYSGDTFASHNHHMIASHKSLSASHLLIVR